MSSPARRRAALLLTALFGVPATGTAPFTRPAYAQPARPVRPALAFPEAGLDDSAAYRGYQTRLFRDAADNTVQVYLRTSIGRVVHVLADAENESAAFTARDASGQPAPLRWAGAGATVTRRGPGGRTRALTYALAADAPLVRVGQFLLGSMRVEREFQDLRGYDAPFGAAPYRIAEYDSLFAALESLPPDVRRRHLAVLNAPDVATLRARVRPALTVSTSLGQTVARAMRPSLDARDTLAVELRADARRVAVARADDAFELRALGGASVPFTVTVTTTGATLHPIARAEIFRPDFLAFVAQARAAAARPGASDSARLQARLLERQVRGVELLASREKFMAGLPTYATYFGRDQLMTALMMRPIWRGPALETVIGSVLQALSPEGAVSHEESVGEQAVREASAEYARLVRAGDLARAYDVLAHARRTRENYVMVDTDFQVPVLVARWIGDPAVPAAEKRAFLLAPADGAGSEPRLARLLREFGRVARRTSAYAAEPSAANLVAFPERAPGVYTGLSWRDSRVGYANGKYAYDVNAVWVPHALEAIGRTLAALPGLGVPTAPLLASSPDLAAGTPLGAYARDSAALGRALGAWRGAERHFVVRLSPDQVRADVAARLAALPAEERAYWQGLLARTGADRDSLTFVAVSLAEDGRPIDIANTDPSTRLFLGDTEQEATAPGAAAAARVRRDVGLFARPYPVGLLVDRVGPVVANDAYAPPRVWEAFAQDPYHGPRVVWGREANLFVLGTATRVAAAPGGPLAGEMRDAMRRVLGAVAESGFRSELWSYDFRGGRPAAVRYGTAGDIQLWSTSDLAVQYALARLPR